ncbi:MAG: helix-turn-helix domain-containing protein [Spirochaetes bacterium]|nr:helix-turn-helix domain-containing protein [Spirochaetota bacterium]
MIQVLKRSSDILRYLEQHRNAGMQDIAKAVRIKFTTACNIVRTLVDLGWVSKQGTTYSIGPALTAFAENDAAKNMLTHIAEESARTLSRDINEGVVVSMLHHGEKYNVAKIAPDREIGVNEKYYSQVSPYTTADGRLLLAYADEHARSAIIDKHGMPGESWNGIKSKTALSAALADIRTSGISIRSTAESEICGIALPIMKRDSDIWGALGVFVPASRFDAARETIIAAMQTTARRMSELLSNTTQGAAL